MKTRKIEEIRADMNPSSYGVTLRIDGREFYGRAECGDTAQDAYKQLMNALYAEYPDMRERCWEYLDINQIATQIWALLRALHIAQQV